MWMWENKKLLKAETALNMKFMGNFTDHSDAESKYVFTVLHNWLYWICLITFFNELYAIERINDSQNKKYNKTLRQKAEPSDVPME